MSLDVDAAADRTELPTGRRPRRSDVVELTIDGMEAKGRGVARLDGRRFHVLGAVPGQRVRARVGGRRRGAIDARACEVLASGPLSVEARCPHAASCGGCTFQTLRYAAQLDHLQHVLAATLAPLCEAGMPPPEPVLGCDDPWHYRNKMEFTFADRRWIEPGEPANAQRGFALGLHVAGRHDKVLDVRRCSIAFEEASAILQSVREHARALGLPPWDTFGQRGLLRHLVLRKGFATGEILIDLVTTSADDHGVEALAQRVHATHPELTTGLHSVHDQPATVVTAERQRVLWGPGRIRERLAGLELFLSTGSFFQVHTVQAERLVACVRDAAAVHPGAVVYDVCCGTGVLGLAVARQARELVGFELVAPAVADAERNAAHNGLDHARFVAGDVSVTLAAADLPEPDVCIVDPPRAGLHPNAHAALLRLAPPRLVYVSCKPATAVRDLLPLLQHGYRIARCQPIDLFPHTPHLECVFTLLRGRP